jgi:hypothetical protein
MYTNVQGLGTTFGKFEDLIGGDIAIIDRIIAAVFQNLEDCKAATDEDVGSFGVHCMTL